MALRSTDLMIGDWVNLGETYIPIQVNAIYGDYIEWGAEHLESIEDIKPLPLTAEILEKNGFKELESQKSRFVWGDFKGGRGALIDFAFYNHPLATNKTLLFIFGQYNEGHMKDVLYVHQLQNAMRLSGIDKEIKL